MNYETIKSSFLDYSTQTQSNNSRQTFAFVLINTKSGSSIGKQWLQKFQSHISINHSYGRTNFILYDLYSSHQREMSFCEIKRLCDDEENVKVVICGGDGTVQWVLSEAIIHKIDFQKVLFSVLPFGTGNDFANSIGWGKINFIPSLNNLKILATQLEQCEIYVYDVWECNIQCYKDGRITQIKGGMEKKLKNNVLSRNFTNYFGIGTDAQITYYAQLLNAKTIFLKKVAYSLACIASCLFPSKKISNKCQSFSKQLQKNDDLSLMKDYELTQTLEQYKQVTNKPKQISIGKDSCLTFLNSTYSMQLQNIWTTPYQIQNKHTNFEEQNSGDGLIEIVSYRNSFSLCLERMFHMAKKVEQGKGPFKMIFRQPNGGKYQETYIHINGEAYKVEKLLKVEICKSKKIRESRIKVLKYKN